VNLFGDLWANGRTPNIERALGVPGTRLFLYGKGGATPGRKMGHLAAIGANPQEALERAQRAAAQL
jgi:5-(carboxyamino)imidazole ribonucleotide synthase